MRVEHMVASLLIGSLILVVGIGTMTDLSTNYGTDMGEEYFGDIEGNITEVFRLVNNTKDQASKPDITAGNAEDSLFSKGFDAFSKVWAYLNLINPLINSVAKAIGIPVIFIQVFWTILMITLSLTIVYLIFRFMPR